MNRGVGGLLVPTSGVDEAEGRDREQVGEEAVGGKRLTGTPNRDMTQRWDDLCANTLIRLALEPNISDAWTVHKKDVRMLA